LGGAQQAIEMTKISESTIFEAIPYVGTNLVTFGMNSLQVEKVLGKIESRSSSHEGGLVEFWSDIAIGYSEKGIVNHIGFGRNMKNIILNKINLFGFDAPVVLKELLKMDAEPLEGWGFLVFFELGIYLTGFQDDTEDDKAAALFLRGAWDSDKPKMKRFQLL
jgi:hypothetical protein